jgi:hypothetical protein
MFNNMHACPLSMKATIDESQLRNAPCAGRTQSCRRLRHRRESRRALRFLHACRNPKPSDNRGHRKLGHDHRYTLDYLGRMVARFKAPNAAKKTVQILGDDVRLERKDKSCE